MAIVRTTMYFSRQSAAKHNNWQPVPFWSRAMECQLHSSSSLVTNMTGVSISHIVSFEYTYINAMFKKCLQIHITNTKEACIDELPAAYISCLGDIREKCQLALSLPSQTWEQNLREVERFSSWYFIDFPVEWCRSECLTNRRQGPLTSDNTCLSVDNGLPVFFFFTYFQCSCRYLVMAFVTIGIFPESLPSPSQPAFSFCPSATFKDWIFLNMLGSYFTHMIFYVCRISIISQ